MTDKIIGWVALLDGKPIKTSTSGGRFQSKLYSTLGYARMAAALSCHKSEYKRGEIEFFPVTILENV